MLRVISKDEVVCVFLLLGITCVLKVVPKTLIEVLRTKAFGIVSN